MNLLHQATWPAMRSMIVLPAGAVCLPAHTRMRKRVVSSVPRMWRRRSTSSLDQRYLTLARGGTALPRRLQPVSAKCRHPSTRGRGSGVTLCCRDRVYRYLQVLGFGHFGYLTPIRRLVSASCSSGQRIAPDFLQTRCHTGIPCLWLALPLAGRVRDFHPQVSAPCRAHPKKGSRAGSLAFRPVRLLRYSAASLSFFSGRTLTLTVAGFAANH